eukprot:4601473-Lingulodinium_polyedra.AAC.1
MISPWEASQRRATFKAPSAAAANHAPKLRPPVAATPSPKGLFTMARRQACTRDCGISWVLREQRQGPCSTLGSSAHPGPSTEVPMASRMRGGSPENT